MSFSWTTHKISEILGQKPTGADQPISHITTDSRKITPGCLFVAIKGDTHDGHDFIPQAIASGAKAILAEKAVSDAKNAVIFQVPSTMAAIRKLAHAYRKAFSIPFIAVVGSVGKTTTKELISSILRGKYKEVLKTEGSLNGFLGIPLTLLGLERKHEVAVIEVGIDEIGAMEQHLAVVEPTHVILTANGPEHLHQLKTVEIAAREELKAFDHALAKHLPLAINLSDPHVNEWFAKNRNHLHPDRFLTYSMTDPHAQFKAKYHAGTDLLEVHAPGWTHDFTSPLPGEHHAHNLLAALTLCTLFHLTPEEMRSGLSTFKTAYGRTEMYRLANSVTLIGDYYNSNPTSAVAALKLLRSTAETAKGTHTHAILADMLELGDGEEQFHRELAQAILDHQISRTWLYGPRMKWLKEELEKRGYSQVKHFTSHDELSATLKGSLKSGDVALVKGSRGMKMETVLKSLLPEEKKTS